MVRQMGQLLHPGLPLLARGLLDLTMYYILTAQGGGQGSVPYHPQGETGAQLGRTQPRVLEVASSSTCELRMDTRGPSWDRTLQVT